MSKRKRNVNSDFAAANLELENKKIKPSSSPTSPESDFKASITIQLVAGSYDGVIHGVTAKILPKTAEFADTFLYTAHNAAIRCLALSPPSAPIPNKTRKIYLASGSTDERIHLYHLSAHAPSKTTVPTIPNITQNPIIENPQNRELGALLHHSSAITALYFPNRGKLLSSAEDRQISIIRTRDWNVLCSVKSPVPKQIGRPSGDTAPVGGTPSGINDFAVHPSMKLMISVSKGEKCMRLWNLVTGKKAGVLNFDKSQTAQLGNGKYSSREGRKVVWGSTEEGDEFCVGFERGLIVYGMDSRPRCIVLPQTRTKIHQVDYFEVSTDDMALTVSTEDGRLIFYSTKPDDLSVCSDDEKDKNTLPFAKEIAQLGGETVGLTGRIKDFSILPVGEGSIKSFIIATAGSNGDLRLWRIQQNDLKSQTGPSKQIGTVLGSYMTNNRITCLKAFIMFPSEDNEDEDEIDQENYSSDSSNISSNSD
ncbi:Protein MAK11 [Golovinomyces cichoracearum]|uniref:Protein MAK11 n=1 Tax=Golovinomyces cichoracearum TaxID=62708 RepID=A0A420ISC8_9PEZI|nr:Protein MAK11 [Golovinomyces cichoracearum]